MTQRGNVTPMHDQTGAGTRDRLARWIGAIAGALAALVGLASVIVLREITGVVSLIDALAEVILSWIPVRLFAKMIGLFGTSAKAWLFAGIAAMLILIASVAGWLFTAPSNGPPRPAWRDGVAFFVITLAGLSLFMVWSVDLRRGGILTYGDLATILLPLGAGVLVFGLVLSLALFWLRAFTVARSLDRPPVDDDRRRFLGAAGLGVLGVASLTIVGREVARVRSGEAVVAASQMPDPITPNDQFYIVSKNFIDPRVDTTNRDWSIRVEGLVNTPRTFSAAELRSLAAPDFVSTLTCISNPIGGPLISTAVWTGAPLGRVLDQTGLDPNATSVVFRGYDGYADSLSIAKATAPTTMLVWAMNGQALPRRHGFPARLIVPGRYGIKNVKWLERIEVISDDYEGYWQQKGWTSVGQVKTESQIRVPGDKAVVPAGRADLKGLAFAGDRGISKVEVSLDNGKTWQIATIEANPSPQELSWVLWRLPWRPTQGTYTLVVRATDGTGAVQTNQIAPPLPDGASGWHHVVVGVAG